MIQFIFLIAYDVSPSFYDFSVESIYNLGNLLLENAPFTLHL